MKTFPRWLRSSRLATLPGPVPAFPKTCLPALASLLALLLSESPQPSNGIDSLMLN
jgi:hypothetical protein